MSKSVGDGRGLSPRVRGNLHHYRDRRAKGGSIPASAGEPAAHGLQMLSHGVYPRECGGTA